MTILASIMISFVTEIWELMKSKLFYFRFLNLHIFSEIFIINKELLFLIRNVITDIPETRKLVALQF